MKRSKLANLLTYEIFKKFLVKTQLYEKKMMNHFKLWLISNIKAYIKKTHFNTRQEQIYSVKCLFLFYAMDFQETFTVSNLRFQYSVIMRTKWRRVRLQLLLKVTCLFISMDFQEMNSYFRA